VPFALARLGRHLQDNNVAPGGLAALFAPFRSGITGALPAGLNLAGLLDGKAAPLAAAAAQPEQKPKWLLPLLGALALGALLWMLLRGQPKEPVAAATPTTDTVVQVRIDTVLVAGTPKQIRLINGVEIDAKEGGIEDLLLTFLNDPNAKAGSDNWFDFGELNFEFGTANILPESQREVSNIIEILKSYPAVKIKLGGYTDRVGNAAENKKLSQARADTVAAALRNAGLAGQVVGAEGYGSEFAKFPESAPEADRVKDRRVSVSVREK
jgi:outer membrane protein OmpA-like peptidoglycan-associated protein